MPTSKGWKIQDQLGLSAVSSSLKILQFDATSRLPEVENPLFLNIDVLSGLKTKMFFQPALQCTHPIQGFCSIDS